MSTPFVEDPGNSATPIIWLDIDGVVNARWVPQYNYRGYREVTLTDFESSTKILYRPAVVRAINEAARSGIEVRWLSMWGAESRSLFGPGLGFSDFASAHEAPPRWGGMPELGIESMSWWKVELISEASKEQPIRPMLWIDDSISTDLLHFWNGPSTLSMIIPAQHRGLDRWDLAAIRGWSRHPEQQIRPDWSRKPIPGVTWPRSHPITLGVDP